MLLTDNRSSIQIAAAEGSVQNWDVGAVGGLNRGSAAGAGAGGYSKTPEGKILAASFVDAFNQMVRSLRDYKAQNTSAPIGHGGELNAG